MSDAEFSTLVADIKANGLREPIIVHEGQVLDGRNRYRACEALGIEPMTRPWDGKGDPLDFVVSKNLHRRHLDESQRAMVAAKIANLRREDTLKRGNAPPVPQICGTEVLQADAARVLNVGLRTVQHAAVIREKGTPELQAVVECGSNGAITGKAISLAMAHPVSRQWKGYWQR